jgi:hypothetical protein
MSTNPSKWMNCEFFHPFNPSQLQQNIDHNDDMDLKSLNVYKCLLGIY